MSSPSRIIDSLHRSATEVAIDDADQIEWRALSDGTAVIEFGILDDLIAGDIEEYDEGSDGPKDDWIGRAEREEKRVGDAAEEIDRRRLVIGDQYPFKVIGTAIT